MILTRMEASEDGKVSKMESVATDQGDWLFGADKYLGFSKAENWGEIPKDKRDTRAAIQAAADAYLDNWGNPDIQVPQAPPAPGWRAARTRAPGTRRPKPAPWGNSRRRSMSPTAATSSTRTSASLSSSTTSPSLMADCQRIRGPRAARCFALRVARMPNTQFRFLFALRQLQETGDAGRV